MRRLFVLGATLGVVGAIAGALASDGGFQRRDDDRRDGEGDGRRRYLRRGAVNRRVANRT